MAAEYDLFASGDHLRQDLAEANGFTTDDLEENRTGVMSASQRKRLWGRALDPLRRSFTALAGWLFFLFIVQVVLSSSRWLKFAARFGFPKLGGLLLLITLCTVGAFLWELFCSFESIYAVTLDLAAGRVDAVEGRVTISSETRDANGMGALYEFTEDRHAYAVGADRFPVTEEACSVLRPYAGSSCRVYATPRSRILLSIEPLKIRRSDRLVH